MNHRAVNIAQFKCSGMWRVLLDRAIARTESEARFLDWIEQNASGWAAIGFCVVDFEEEADARLFYLTFA